MDESRPLLSLFIIFVCLALLAAIFLPNFNFIRNGHSSPKNTCINNLRLIDGAIQEWAIENHKTNTDIPTWTNLKPYLGRDGTLIPKCPSGGTYILGHVIDNPTCTYPGHAL